MNNFLKTVLFFATIIFGCLIADGVSIIVCNAVGDSFSHDEKAGVFAGLMFVFIMISIGVFYDICKKYNTEN